MLEEKKPDYLAQESFGNFYSGNYGMELAILRPETFQEASTETDIIHRSHGSLFKNIEKLYFL